MPTPHIYKAVAGGARHKARLKLSVLLAAVALVIIGLAVLVILLVRGHSNDAAVQPAAAPADNTSPSAQTDKQNLVKSNTPPVTNAVLITESFAGLGQFLADPQGNTLYTYDHDTTGASTCTASCLASWPPYETTTATGLPTDVGTTKRSDDGKLQYTYKGKPLYYYTVDRDSGGVNGDGMNGFRVAKP